MRVRRRLATHYPPALRDAGVVGKSEVAVLIDAAGSVGNVLVARGAGHADFDLATIAVARGMRFRPAAQGGPVPFFSVMPVTWTLEPDR
ncbi:MAG: energy transducer TonB [Gemmatimonadota bacterium]